jgi:hypothetical protein
LQGSHQEFQRGPCHLLSRHEPDRKDREPRAPPSTPLVNGAFARGNRRGDAGLGARVGAEAVVGERGLLVRGVATTLVRAPVPIVSRGT